MIPLVDKPRVVVFPDFHTGNGETKIVLNSATNIAPQVEVVFAKNADEFRRLSEGLTFVTNVTAIGPGD